MIIRIEKLRIEIDSGNTKYILAIVLVVYLILATFT